MQWLLTMQNDDGGWPAFKKNTYKKWPELLPVPEAKSVLTDSSSADLTGRTLEFPGIMRECPTGKTKLQRQCGG